MANLWLDTAGALMFRGAVGQHVLSLMPASEFAQKKVGIMARLADVVHHDRAANLARVVDDDVAETHQSLRNRGRDGNVLDFAQRNIFRLRAIKPLSIWSFESVTVYLTMLRRMW